MGVIKFRLDLGAEGDISSIAVNQLGDDAVIEMQLFCEGCGIHTKAFTIGSSESHKFQCEGCNRIGMMELVNMVGGFKLPCNGRKQGVATMICSQFVPHDTFLKVRGELTVTDADGEHKVIMCSSQTVLSKGLQDREVKVQIVNDFVRINN